MPPVKLAGALLLAAALAGCALGQAPPPQALSCPELRQAIRDSRAEQTEGLVRQLAEMPVDWAAAFYPPAWTAGPVPQEDPQRLSALERTLRQKDCRGPQQAAGAPTQG